MANFYQRYNQWKKSGELHGFDEDEEPKPGFDCGNSGWNIAQRSRPKLFYFAFLSVLSCFLILAPQFLTSPFAFSRLYSIQIEDKSRVPEVDFSTSISICSSLPYGTMCCDRSSIRSDECIMKGDVEMDPGSNSISLYRDNDLGDSTSWLFEPGQVIQHEKIKPYTRKWETSVMNSIGELDLFVKTGNKDPNQHHCDVKHDVPAVFFSTGGYTGNAYHEINDGILPLYITSQRFNKKVVFVILDFHNWWLTKYADVLAQLSDYPVINFGRENRTHCFPEAIVGLRIHDELAIDPKLMEDGKTIVDFSNLLDRAYWPRIRSLIRDEERKAQQSGSKQIRKQKDGFKKLKLTIIARTGSREIRNENLLVKEAEEIGFTVQVLRPDRTTELAKLYRDLNSSDVMVGVHGAAMTYMLFMKPGSVFIQIIPIGLDWPSETFYGEPAVKLGLRYIGYKVLPRESSLYDIYGKDDPVLTDPDGINNKGWEYTKKIYLDNQNLKLNLPRFRKRLVRAYNHITKKNKNPHQESE